MLKFAFTVLTVFFAVSIPLESVAGPAERRSIDIPNAAVIVPMLSGQSSGLQNHFDWTRSFILDCALTQNHSRSHVSVLYPPYQQATMCERGVDCSARVDPRVIGNVVIRNDTSYNLGQKLENFLHNGKMVFFTLESTIIILTDIPCSQYEQYGDLDDVLNQHFATTVKNVNDFRIHTVVVFLDDENDRNHLPCAPVRQHHDREPTGSHMHIDYVAFSDLPTMGNLCDREYA